MFNNRSILVTGGTGSFGQQFVQLLLETSSPKRVIVYSRDELKQSEMSKRFPESKYESIRYFIGDVRDEQRLRRAMQGVDFVVHAAALKQVPACEYNPIEAVKTNIHGAENVINASIDAGVSRVLALSTDKACSPVNLYGATKQVAEKLFVHGNVYSGSEGPRFACVRYGNVIGSRGSVVPLFKAQRSAGRVTVTDPRMTRFWITLEQGAKFVASCIEQMQGGEVFIPKLPTMNIMDVAAAIAPGCAVDQLGIRHGEKLHEVMISADEARDTIERTDRYVIMPPAQVRMRAEWRDGKPVPEHFTYSSDLKDWVLSKEEFTSLAGR